eukprot:contig_7776_g1836
MLVSFAVVSTAAVAAARQRRTSRSGTRSRQDMPLTLATLADADFRLLLRMDRDTFWALFDLVRSSLETNEEMAILSSGQPIPPECRLALALRVLAGASYLDCMLAFGAGRSTVFTLFKPLVPIRAIGFSRGGRNQLRGCLSAIDGIAVKIQRPSVQAAPNPMSYYNRKSFLALNAQVVVGADYKVQFLSVVAAGSCHDSMAFAVCGLATMLASEDDLPAGFWAAADDAFVAGMRVLTPWPGRNLLWEKDSFNFFQSSNRIFVEQVFGQMVGRWGVLWKPLRFTLPTATLVIRVCQAAQFFGRPQLPCAAYASGGGCNWWV